MSPVNSHLNGSAARSAMREMRELPIEADAKASKDKLLEIARKYQSEIVFQGDEELVRSVELLEQKSEILGIKDHPDVVKAILAIKALPRLGW